MTPDVIVIGAGIIGAACAAELAAQGMQVEVFDAGGIGGGTTSAGMGHVVVMNDSPAELALSRYSRALWLELAPQLRERDAFARCGTLWIAADEEELDAARALGDAFSAAGVRTEMLDQAALRASEPALDPALCGGLRVEDDGIVYAPTASEWLLTRSPRIRVTTHCAVRALRPGGVLLADGTHRAARHVVVANGLAARELLPDLPLVPKKGHLLITDRYPATIRHQLLELGYIKSAHHATGTSVAFNAQPRPTGQLLIGSSRQFDTTDPAVEMNVLAAMLQRAARYLPALASLHAIRAWTGFRVASPDGMPLIGPAANDVWVAAGHEGLGVTTSLGTAKLLAAQMLDLPLPLDETAFLPRRFSKEFSHG